MTAGMPMATAGLAIFVKTPGVSPLKTRLAQAIGQDAAEAFHRLAAAAVADVAKQAQAAMPGLVAYWAVAEREALDAPIWRDLPCIARVHRPLGGGTEALEVPANVLDILGCNRRANEDQAIPERELGAKRICVNVA